MKSKYAHIILYKNEFKTHIWNQYCKIAGLDSDADTIKLVILKSKCKVV